MQMSVTRFEKLAAFGDKVLSSFHEAPTQTHNGSVGFLLLSSTSALFVCDNDVRIMTQLSSSARNNAACHCGYFSTSSLPLSCQLEFVCCEGKCQPKQPYTKKLQNDERARCQLITTYACLASERVARCMMSSLIAMHIWPDAHGPDSADQIVPWPTRWSDIIL